MNRKIVTLLSGGLDSATLLWLLRENQNQPIPIAINYGQRHARELQAAQALVQAAGLSQQFRVVNVPELQSILGGSSQTDRSIDVPKGHYADPSMKLTVVPNRNMIMLSIAAGYAISMDAVGVAFAAHAGDHPIYPDCRPEFITRCGEALRYCHYRPLELHAPFQYMTKGEIVKTGLHLGVPYELTWSCYQDQERPCGECGTCVERQEAFEAAGVPDPALSLS